jgi:hypothetical protein
MNENQTTIQSIAEQFGEIKKVSIDNHIVAEKETDGKLFQVALNLVNTKSQSGGIKAFAFTRINGYLELYVAFFAPTSFPRKEAAI